MTAKSVVEKSNHPMFSIIVPAYNSASFINKCINSVLNQTFYDFELILIDDGSEDETLHICNKFAKKDERLSVLHQNNQGHTAARNKGLINSCGEYVIFLDSDDWIDENTLAVCYKKIMEYYPDIIIYEICKHSKANVTIINNNLADGIYDNEKKATDLNERLLMPADGKSAFPKSLSGKVFKKTLIEKYQFSIPGKIKIGEDGACFIATALAADSICVVSGVFYHALVRFNSVSHTADKHALQRCLELLLYYQNLLDLDNQNFRMQFDRFVVMQIYTAIQFVSATKCDSKWIRSEFNRLMKNDFVKSAIKQARFDPRAKKFSIKKLILRFRLFEVVKILMTMKGKRLTENE